MLKSIIIVKRQYIIRNCARSLGPPGNPCWPTNVDIVGGRNALLTVGSAADMHCWSRPRLISTSNDGIHSKHLNASFYVESHKKNYVTQIYNLKRFYSTDKNCMDLAERFRNDSEAKSFMQELLTDFERTEPVTDEERTIVKEKLGFNPVLKKDVGESETSEQHLIYRLNQHQVSELSESNLHVGKDDDFVFNIEEIVDMLKEENATDVCVIQLPKKIKYVDYMVLATGRSTRHLKAMAQHFNQKYKQMKAEHHRFLTIEGKNAVDWMCIDFGNIVLHFMLEETREVYELEKLWTLGPEFDDQSQRMNVYEMRMFNEDRDLESNREQDTIDESVEGDHDVDELNDQPTRET